VPFPMFRAAERRVVARYLEDAGSSDSEWFKGRAAVEPFMLALGRNPTAVGLLRNVLRENIVIWGASSVTRRPRQIHHWHSGIESASPDGGFVSLWAGVRNTSHGTQLKFIRGSHQFGRSLQQALHERGLEREAANDADILDIARTFDRRAEIVILTPNDGEAILFDGRIWHGSENANDTATRQALLLQYARADVPVYRPDLRKLDWPLRLLSSPRPPVVVIAGEGCARTNRIVKPPGPNTELKRAV